MSGLLGAVEALKAQIRKARTFFSEDEIQLYYDIGDKIGAGFFATVFKAQEKKTGQEVAIKCIDKAKVGEKVAMLQEEVNILSKVKHPNCVQMLEIFESEKHVHLVMELVTGGELFDRIMDLKIFNESLCSRVICQICMALTYLHELGIVHRDLKPENILLDTPDLATATVKLTDFGLSKIMRGKRKFLHSRCGTPAYAAPELVEGKPYGPKVDMWAVGCLMYVMLCGSPPFRGADTQELFVQICKGQYSLSGKSWSKVSRQAKIFIRKLLVVNPEGRYSAAEALEDPWIRSVGGEGGESLNMQSAMREFREETEEAVRDYRDQSSANFDPHAGGPSGAGAAADGKRPVREGSGGMGGSIGSTSTFSSGGMDNSRTNSQLRLGQTSQSSLRIAADADREAKGVLGVAVSVNAIDKMDEQYPDWPALSAEFTQGNLLGCASHAQVKKIMAASSTWKRRAWEAGYLRPFLLLASMHPRQRLGCGVAIQLNLTENLWYGDPHREAWEIISHQLEGIRRKTGGHNAMKREGEGGPTWWDTMLQVSNTTLSHFWSQDNVAKQALKALPNLNRDQIKQACQDPEIRHIQQLEDTFLNLVFKKLMKAKGGDENVTSKYTNTKDLEGSAQGEDRIMLENLKREISGPVCVKFLNFYCSKAYQNSNQANAFMTWAEKERTPTMSSVFLNKLPVRTLLPVVFAIACQRLFLATIGVYCHEYWEHPSQSSLPSSSSFSSSSSSRSSGSRRSSRN
mmetsp:Transcript_37156/g.58503  ORF Transcript_37156/g.58503 Transcript_37156/m.58503 type:complete len:743 (-) Transcript_37156:1309-3537(-)